MGIPTNAEILAMLDQLDRGKTADDLESQWLDFKPWSSAKEDMKVAIEYSVCFTNAEGGALVFGVKDRTQGRQQAIQGAGKCDIDVWRRGIYEGTTPHINVEIDRLAVPEGTGSLLVVRIPQGIDPPYGTAKGLFQRRVEKNCMAMNPQQWHRARISSGAVDWSGQLVSGLTMAELDRVEIERGRNIVRRLKPNSDLANLKDAAFLAGVGAVANKRVTHTGLLLFGREDVIAEICPQHVVQYARATSETHIARNDVHQAGLLKILEGIEQIFLGPENPEQELSLGLLKQRIPAFPVDVVREAVLNAVTHRDYADPGKVLIRHTNHELIVTSPGGFIAGITPQNILRHESRARNQSLAHAFLKLGLVEQVGVGRIRIFKTMLAFGKRPPKYETNGEQVTLRVYDGGFDERMARLVAKWQGVGHEIDLDGLLVLSFLKTNAFIDSASASAILQLSRDEARETLDRLAQPKTGILERRGNAQATYHLTKKVSADLLGATAYTAGKGIDRSRHKEMVRQFVIDHGSISPKQCRELLGLGESNTARTAVSKLLTSLSGANGFLRREGKGPKTHYVLRESNPDRSR